MHRRKILVAFSLLVLSALACNVLGGSNTDTAEIATPTPETITVVVTATDPPAATPTEGAQDANESTATAKQDLNVRGGPGTGYPVNDFLPGGKTVPVIGQNEDGSWLMIDLDGVSGWVSEYYTDNTGLEDVPVVQAPPPPVASSDDEPGDDSQDSGDSGGSGSGDSGDSGGGSGAPSDSDIRTEVDIKDDAQSFNDVISYPDGDTTDRVSIRVVGFDGGTSSGYLNFTLTCSGEGVGNVKVSGDGDCNENWSRIFYTDNYNYTITIKLESGGSAYVNWNLVISANN
jgi:hypothetical protein